MNACLFVVSRDSPKDILWLGVFLHIEMLTLPRHYHAYFIHSQGVIQQKPFPEISCSPYQMPIMHWVNTDLEGRGHTQAVIVKLMLSSFISDPGRGFPILIYSCERLALRL